MKGFGPTDKCMLSTNKCGSEWFWSMNELVPIVQATGLGNSSLRDQNLTEESRLEANVYGYTYIAFLLFLQWKADNLCVFLVASLGNKKKLLNLGVLLKEEFAPRGANSRADLIKKGGKNQSDRVVSPESVSTCVIQWVRSYQKILSIYYKEMSGGDVVDNMLD